MYFMYTTFTSAVKTSTSTVRTTGEYSLCAFYTRFVSLSFSCVTVHGDHSRVYFQAVFHLVKVSLNNYLGGGGGNENSPVLFNY